ncbi:hypothetical protein N7326_03045 [Corynebacterium sp. ES2794-CONJ1]|uniref:AMIN-like domain-containing (lipo)protein n=1 Tax=unclassified Corynebacterium TaxID=2624378 RepID=UPI002169F81D|nr:MULTISPECIES: hypothetical protein [unclassified Corynebacterium]MCS4491436.1 hypothetical protein [Corynebacterium sp. ES2715-CONJ3]MCU9518851.1 hypothetical protein [Corynebacterium sp. ES2794-CONJ1]
MSRPTLMRTLVATGAASLVACTSACAPQSPTESTADFTSAAQTGTAFSSPAASSSASAGITPLGEASKEMRTQRPSVPSLLVPQEVRIGSHKGFDRVVIEFAGTGKPGWYIDYVDTPTQQASGLVVDIPGDSFLNVNIDGLVLPFEVGLDSDAVTDLVKGPGPIVTAVKPSGTFEGRGQFVIGLNGSPAPYSVEVLDNPVRVVIDIRKQ